MPTPVAKIVFDADNSKLNTALSQADAGFTKAESGAAALNGSLTKLAGAFLTFQTAVQLFNSAKLGEEFLNARAQFNRYVEHVEAGTQRLRAAVNGTLADMKLWQAANEAFRQGLNFEQVETIFQFAEQQSDATGDALETIFEQVARALSKTEAGIGRTAAQLVRYGIVGSDAEQIMAQITRQLEQQTGAFDDNLDRVSQASTAWENASARIGVSVRETLLPSLKAVADLIEYFDDEALTTQIGRASDQFMLQARRLGERGWRPPKISEKDFDVYWLLQDLQNNAKAGQLSLEDTEQALVKIKTLMQGETRPGALSAYGELLENLTPILENFRTVAAKVTPPPNTTPFGPTEADFAEHQRRIAAQEQAQNQAEQQRLAALQARRDELAQERELAKARIALGQGTYADLKTILERQKTDHQDFLDSDYHAKLAWMNDSALVYQQDKANSAAELSAKVRNTDEAVEDILNSDRYQTEEKLRLALARVRIAEQEFAGNHDLARKYMEMRRQLEQEYQQFLMEQYQEQLNMYQTIFGQPALALLDRFISEGKVKFEDFFKDIVRMALRYLLQAALMRLFGMLLGPPSLPGAGGGSSGGIPLGAMGANPNFPNPAVGLPDLAGLAFPGYAPRTPSPTSPAISVLPTPVTVQILASKQDLAYLVKLGNDERARSSLHS